jgi:hypothetical protein
VMMEYSTITKDELGIVEGLPAYRECRHASGSS